MKQYSVDLRERLPGAIDAGLSQAEASRLFGVGTSTITRWRQRERETGTVAPKPRSGRRPVIGPAQAAALRAQVAQPPYSPDFPPIEQAFSTLKTHRRGAGARAFAPVVQAIGAGLERISRRDIAGYYRHCGFAILHRDDTQPS
jgi:transposase